ncbi:MAG: TetR/AcrR family transcriptional regulator, tetracycline repressor protein [Actinomycetota bacterium]|jgi:AcrR family transcriptional regulator|nr:TetR/AcrR family transcriptional regulator, tetracycline repressor protein [Actinomycetota bacterium]
MASTGTGSTKERLSRESLAAGALDLADREGIDAVTIRRLATEHSVTPMALYWHFKDKDAVLDGIAERVYASVVLPAPSDGPWDDQLREVLLAVLAAIRPHPLAADLLAPRIMKSEAGLVLAERVIGMLRRAGFSASEASQTASFLLCSIVTLVTSEPGKQNPLTGEAQEDVDRSKRAQLASLPPKLFPNLLESAPYFVTCDNEDEYFARGMDFLVEGTRGVRPA